MTMSKMMQAVVVAGALAVPMAATPSAQLPITIGGGLVNVQVGSIQVIDDIVVRDVLNDLTVSIGVAANIAANVCGVTVGVVARDLARNGDFACETADQFVTITQ